VSSPASPRGTRFSTAHVEVLFPLVEERQLSPVFPMASPTLLDFLSVRLGTLVLVSVPVLFSVLR
jgi:hypothetical protein